MSNSTAGDIVAEVWLRTPLIRPNVELDTWVLMPNHLHGIVIIKSPAPDQAEQAIPGAAPANHHPGVARLKADSLGAIIGQIKGACTKRIRLAAIADFDWQPRFHDHIIRDEHALANIRQYISDNPAQWALDELNPHS